MEVTRGCERYKVSKGLVSADDLLDLDCNGLRSQYKMSADKVK